MVIRWSPNVEPNLFTSFRKPSAANRLFQRFGNDKIRFYRKDTKKEESAFSEGKYYV